MAKETKVKVRLDTKQARGEVRELKKEASRAGSSISSNISSTLSSGFKMVGAGAAIGAGISAVKTASSSGIGDILSGPMGFIGQKFNDWFLGDTDDRARAFNAARETTAQVFAPLAGAMNAVPPQARMFFEAESARNLEREKGRSLVMSDPAFLGDEKKIFDFFENLGQTIADALSEAFDAALDRALSFWR